MSSKVVSLVEGSLAHVVDESSDEESDDEEVEIFANADATDLTVEPAFSVQTNSQTEEDANDTIEIDIGLDEPEDDVFGIAYKPMRRKEKGYDMPSGPAFEDEAEFERDLVSSSNAEASTTVEEDDEFDCGADDDMTPEAADAAVQEAIQRALLKKQALEAEEVANLSKPINVPASHPPAEDVSTSAIDKEEKSISIIKSSQQALDDIKSIYSSGLGDQEVAQLVGSDSNTPAATAAPLESTAKKNVMSMAIEEGDEEEELRLEEEEEEQRVKLENMALESTQELESQWNPDAIAKAQQSLQNAPVGEAHAEDINICIDDFTPMSYTELLSFARGVDLSAYEKQIVVADISSPSFFSTKLKLGVDENGATQADQQAFPFLLAELDYDPSVPQHKLILQSIYMTLIADESSQESVSLPPAQGPHWERIGFQGLDPRTDVNRSMKMFAVLQMSHFMDINMKAVKALHVFSGSDVYHNNHVAQKPISSAEMDKTWPFFCVSISFTKESIQAFRRGDFNKKCNKRQNVLSVLHDFHHAQFFEFARMLVEAPTTHFANHLATLRTLCSTNPLSLLKSYKNYGDPSMQAALLKSMKGNAKTDAKMVDKKASRKSFVSNMFGSSGDAPKAPKLEKLHKFNNLEDLDDTMVENVNVADEGNSKASKFLA